MISTLPHTLGLSAAGRLRTPPRSAKTLARWIIKGSRGVFLEATYDGYRYLTSKAALDKFEREQTERRLGRPRKSDSTARVSIAAKCLDGAGISRGGMR